MHDPFGRPIASERRPRARSAERPQRLAHLPPRPARLRNWVGMALGAALLAADLTLLYLGMRQLMDLGGSCASGGPYVVAQPCPEGGAIVLSAGIPLLFVAGAIFAGFGWRLGDKLPLLLLLGWAALFLSLGWNFLDYGLISPVDGIAGGYLVSGVVFVLMGAPALLPLPAVVRGLGPRRVAIVGVAAVAVGVGVAGGLWAWSAIG